MCRPPRFLRLAAIGFFWLAPLAALLPAGSAWGQDYEIEAYEGIYGQREGYQAADWIEYADRLDFDRDFYDGDYYNTWDDYVYEDEYYQADNWYEDAAREPTVYDPGNYDDPYEGYYDAGNYSDYEFYDDDWQFGWHPEDEYEVDTWYDITDEPLDWYD